MELLWFKHLGVWLVLLGYLLILHRSINEWIKYIDFLCIMKFLQTLGWPIQSRDLPKLFFWTNHDNMLDHPWISNLVELLFNVFLDCSSPWQNLLLTCCLLWNNLASWFFMWLQPHKFFGEYLRHVFSTK